MRSHAGSGFFRPPALRLAAVLVSIVACSMIGAATAQAGQVTVMTQNLYQGTEFAHIQALTKTKSPSFEEAIAATSQDYGTYLATRFKDRAKQIAAAVAANKPVLIGMQEVATWHKGEFNPLNPFGLPPEVSEDFTKVLIEAIEADGLHYEAVSQTERLEGNFTLAFPVAPGPPPFGLTAVGMVERGVILARSDLPAGQLHLSNAQSGTFSCEFCKVTIENPITHEIIPFTDSWESIDANFKGRPFRFITTHLDALEPTGAIRALQAKEVLEGPANTTMPVIMTGDFNAGPNTPPSGTGPAAYNEFIGSGFTDTWPAAGNGAPPLTCCHLAVEDLVNDPAAEYQPGNELDHVLTHGNFPILSEHLVGNTPNLEVKPFIWPSDHAGVVATFGPKVISGTRSAPLVVKNGEWVELVAGGKISGPVTVEPGGAFDVEGSVEGSKLPGAVVTGSVKANKPALLRLCGAQVTGPVEALEGSGPVVIGENTAGCTADLITGPLTVKNNHAGVQINGNLISGPTTVTGNEGGTTVINNSVFGSLTVLGNTGVVVDKPNFVSGSSKLQ
jgi:hypothetical protein